MNLDELETYYLQKKLDGADYSTIRKELKEKGLPMEDISRIIDAIDTKIVSGMFSKQGRSEMSATMVIGFLLLVGGCVLTFGTYFKWIDLGNYYVISYGPIITGIGMMAGASAKRSTMFNRKRRF